MNIELEFNKLQMPRLKDTFANRKAMCELKNMDIMKILCTPDTDLWAGVVEHAELTFKAVEERKNS